MELKTDEVKRKELLKPYRNICLFATFGVPVILMALCTLFAVNTLSFWEYVKLFMAMEMIVGICIGLLITGTVYLIEFTRSRGQKVYVYDDRFVLTFSSGELGVNSDMSATAISVDGYELKKRNIVIKGVFRKKMKDTMSLCDSDGNVKVVRIMRCLEDEEILIQLLDRLLAK